MLQDCRQLQSGEIVIKVGNGASVTPYAVGNVNLLLPTGKSIYLTNVYFVPNILRNIISVSCLDKDKYSVMFKDNSCFLFHNDEQVCTGHLSQGVYVLEHIKPLLYTTSTSSNTHTQTVNYTYLWHCRLRHISENRIHKLYKDGFL